MQKPTIRASYADFTQRPQPFIADAGIWPRSTATTSDMQKAVTLVERITG